MPTGLLCLILAVLSAGCTADYPQAAPTQTQVSQHTYVPLKLTDNLPIVLVKIDGYGPYRMLLDTGSGAVVLPTRIVSQMSLDATPSTASRAVQGMGGYSAMGFRRVSELQIGKAYFHDLDIAVADLPPTFGGPGAQIDGILGLRVFQDLTLTIDYLNKRLIMDPTRRLSPQGIGVIPAEMPDGQRLVVNIQTPELDMTTPMLVDTGANSGFFLTDDLAQQLPFAYGPVAAGEVMTPTGAMRMRMGRLAVDLKFGMYYIRQPVVTLASEVPRLYARDSSDPNAAARSLIGGDVLRHFAISIDQQSGLIQLAHPGPSTIDMPAVRMVWFGVDTARIEDSILVTGPGAAPKNEAQVKAKLAVGLQEGDRIVAFNGVNITKVDAAMHQRMTENSNAVKLTVLRDGNYINTLAPVVTLIPPADASPTYNRTMNVGQ